jgi:2-polyprenyl-6-methoxyphenol hydroxylase-like FAD-dependent oxidoreductase
VLARCLAQGGDVAEALRRYEQRRQKRTAHMQGLSRAVGRFGRWKHPLAVRGRELVTWALLGNPIGAKNIERDLAYDF